MSESEIILLLIMILHPLVPKLYLGIEPAGAVRDGQRPQGELREKRINALVPATLLPPLGETEFRRQWRSQTEFGNEGKGS